MWMCSLLTHTLHFSGQLADRDDRNLPSLRASSNLCIWSGNLCTMGKASCINSLPQNDQSLTRSRKRSTVSLSSIKQVSNPISMSVNMCVCVLTTFLHYLNCLALWGPSQAQSVSCFGHVLLPHLRTLHLFILVLTGLESRENQQEETTTLSSSLHLHKVWCHPDSESGFLLETCRLSRWVDAERHSASCLPP